MFEGSYNFYDIEKIDEEIKSLCCLLNKFLNKRKKLRKLKIFENCSSTDRNTVISDLITTIDKNKFNVEKTIKYIEDIKNKDNFKCLDYNFKNLIEKMYEILKEFENDNINSFSQKFLKNKILNLIDFIKLLKKQKETTRKHIRSIDKTERKRLNQEILKNENLIYNRFYPMFSQYIDLQKYSFKHLENSSIYDFINFFNYKISNIFKVIGTILIIIGLIIFNSYLSINGLKFSINLFNSQDMFLTIGVISICYIVYFIVVLVPANYFLTKTNMKDTKNKKSKKIIFVISRLSLILIILLPFILENQKISDIANEIIDINVIFDYFNLVLCFQISLLSLYFIIYCFEIKKFNFLDFILCILFNGFSFNLSSIY
ncbi:hypothetical protein [Campylobacter pinnipediorum]|uniref:hypothetical protein n=1 Tax=Campylobacter pinnipediorum TaxID=1965231 RepID=UPI000995635B|nr:hypothetical protein [Campylobacter pinnipediorum]